jgi:hypothetical protein
MLVGTALIACLIATPSLRAVDSKPPKHDLLALGIGYPDLRLRYSPVRWGALEAKAALASGVQVYSLRAYGLPYSWQQLDLVVGAEAGLANLSGVEGIDGSGDMEGAFVGLEYSPYNKLRLNIDAGPYRVAASSGDVSTASWEWIVNTALYWVLF